MWMRSSRELVMSLHMLNSETGQVHHRDWRLQNEERSADADFGTAEHPWILGELAGRASYKLLHVFSTRKSAHFSNTSGQNGDSNGLTVSRNIHSAPLEERPSDRMFQLMTALERAESEEQDRIRAWIADLPLRNSLHPIALTCDDEATVEPLGQEACSELIQPSPLVRTGLDRMSVLDQAAKVWEADHKAKTGETKHFRTKDVALGLSLTLVDPACITACIQNLTATHRNDPGT
ncbi:MAG: hypothetical protein SGILL_008933 [Bacillariaceae sp.]